MIIDCNNITLNKECLPKVQGSRGEGKVRACVCVPVCICGCVYLCV